MPQDDLVAKHNKSIGNNASRKDDGNVKVLKIKIPPVPLKRKEPHQMQRYEARETESMSFKESQAKIFQLEKQLKELQETITQQNHQLKEAAEIMLDQQTELEKSEKEREKLEREVDGERKQRIAAERKLQNVSQCVTTAIIKLEYEESKNASEQMELDYHAQVKPKLDLFATGIQNRLEKLKQDQYERKSEVAKTKERIQQLLKFMSFHRAAAVPTLPGASKPVKVDTLNTPKIKIKLRKSKRLARHGRTNWTVTKVNDCKNKKNSANKRVKHCRDKAKFYEGFYCICGVKCTTRQALNSHIKEVKCS